MNCRNIAVAERYRYDLPDAKFEVCKIIAAENNFNLADFNLLDYGVANFQRFIYTVQQETDYAAALLLAVSIIEGARDWTMVEQNFKEFRLIKAQCLDALMSARNRNEIEVISETIDRINGRNAAHKKYDGDVRSITELFDVLKRAAVEAPHGEYSLADCRTLTLLMHLILSSAGLDNTMRRIISAEGAHAYTEFQGKYYENTGENRHLVNKAALQQSVANREIDIWSYIAEHRAMVLAGALFDIKNGLAADAPIERILAELEILRQLDPQGLYIIGVLAKGYGIFAGAQQDETKALMYLRLGMEAKAAQIELFLLDKASSYIKEQILNGLYILRFNYKKVWRDAYQQVPLEHIEDLLTRDVFE